jgi:hypothetical protein
LQIQAIEPLALKNTHSSFSKVWRFQKMSKSILYFCRPLRYQALLTTNKQDQSSLPCSEDAHSLCLKLSRAPIPLDPLTITELLSAPNNQSQKNNQEERAPELVPQSWGSFWVPGTTNQVEATQVNSQHFSLSLWREISPAQISVLKVETDVYPNHCTLITSSHAEVNAEVIECWTTQSDCSHQDRDLRVRKEILEGVKS